MKRVAIIIPARFASTRLPGKPLADIHGKTVIQHVWEKAVQVSSAASVTIAVDDERVLAAVERFGGNAVMTDPAHPSGTDRLVEVRAKVSADVYLNIQGDEPLIRPADLEKLIALMMRPDAPDVGTLCHPIGIEEARDPNYVKVVLRENGDALYFSRALIPYPRDAGAEPLPFDCFQKHVGVYAYSDSVLAKYSSLPVPFMENFEKLEQLRLLFAGFRIGVLEVEKTGPGVDTPESLEEVRRLMAG